jgi:hypothetical protein
MAILSASRAKVLVMAAAIAGGLGLAGSAQAAGGCGPGFHPNPWGLCRPNWGPRPYPYWRRPAFYGGYGRPRPYYARPYGFYGPRPFY